MPDPKKLEAWANQGGAPPKKGAPPPEASEPDDTGEGEDQGEEQEEGEGAGDLAEKYGDLIEMLEAHADEIDDQCEMLDQGALTDPGNDDEEFRGAVKSAVDGLDPALVDLMGEKLKGVSWDDAMDIADHLADDGHVAEPECFAGFLFHAGAVL